MFSNFDQHWSLSASISWECWTREAGVYQRWTGSWRVLSGMSPYPRLDLWPGASMWDTESLVSSRSSRWGDPGDTELSWSRERMRWSNLDTEVWRCCCWVQKIQHSEQTSSSSTPAQWILGSWLSPCRWIFSSSHSWLTCQHDHLWQRLQSLARVLLDSSTLSWCCSRSPSSRQTLCLTVSCTSCCPDDRRETLLDSCWASEDNQRTFSVWSSSRVWSQHLQSQLLHWQGTRRHIPRVPDSHRWEIFPVWTGLLQHRMETSPAGIQHSCALSLADSAPWFWCVCGHWNKISSVPSYCDVKDCRF